MWLDPLKPERVESHGRRARLPRGDRPRDPRVDCLDVPAVGEPLDPRMSASPRVQIDDPFDRAAADAAEPDRIAREHDAIGLAAGRGPAPRRPPLRTRRPRPEYRHRPTGTSCPRPAASRKSASISASGALRARISRAAVWIAGVCALELLLVPRRRQRRARRDQILPLQRAGSCSAVTFGSHGSGFSAAPVSYATSDV